MEPNELKAWRREFQVTKIIKKIIKWKFDVLAASMPYIKRLILYFEIKT